MSNTSNNVEAKIAELFQWIEDHNGDVDGEALREACDDVATLAARAAGIRVPMNTYGRRMFTLDFACCVSGSDHSPHSLVKYTSCPGVTAMRNYLVS